jgi:hypothetical protein
MNDFTHICSAIGPCIVLDAAQVGSYAHRLRDYWTNLAPSHDITRALDAVSRPANLSVNDILEPGRSAQICRHLARPPWYPANVVGQPLSCLPTLVAYVGSYAFRYNDHDQPGLGLVHDSTVSAHLCSLTIEEKENELSVIPLAAPQQGSQLMSATPLQVDACTPLLCRVYLLSALASTCTMGALPFHILWILQGPY